MRKSTEMCTLFVNRGCDVNAKNSCEDTPLHLAERANNIALCTLLLKSGRSARPAVGGGFGQFVVAGGGFGQPAAGGFGLPAAAGFGQPAAAPGGSCAAPAAGGFGAAPAAGGFGAKPTTGGFGYVVGASAVAKTHTHTHTHTVPLRVGSGQQCLRPLDLVREAGSERRLRLVGSVLRWQRLQHPALRRPTRSHQAPAAVAAIAVHASVSTQAELYATEHAPTQQTPAGSEPCLQQRVGSVQRLRVEGLACRQRRQSKERNDSEYVD